MLVPLNQKCKSGEEVLNMLHLHVMPAAAYYVSQGLSVTIHASLNSMERFRISNLEEKFCSASSIIQVHFPNPCGYAN